MSQSAHILSVESLFKYYKALGEKTFEQLDDFALFAMLNQGDNSIGNIVKHLHGNMLSRWTDFLVSDGEKTWRDRDGEFTNTIDSRQELLRIWNEGWSRLFGALDQIENDDLAKEVLIRGEKHLVTDAIMRQQMHYAYHVGQIVFLGKTIKGDEWKSLSIAKNQSQEYNAEHSGKIKENEESIWKK